jgi:hypothetical protein
MIRFILGAVAGGLAVWFWRDEILAFAQSKTHGVRAGAVDTLQAVEKRTEKVLDRTKEQISAALQAGQRTLTSAPDRSMH